MSIILMQHHLLNRNRSNGSPQGDNESVIYALMIFVVIAFLGFIAFESLKEKIPPTNNIVLGKTYVSEHNGKGKHAKKVYSEEYFIDLLGEDKNNYTISVRKEVYDTLFRGKNFIFNNSTLKNETNTRYSE